MLLAAIKPPCEPPPLESLLSYLFLLLLRRRRKKYAAAKREVVNAHGEIEREGKRERENKRKKEKIVFFLVLLTCFLLFNWRWRERATNNGEQYQEIDREAS